MIPSAIAAALTTGTPTEVLIATLDYFHCISGTVHRLNPASGMLEITASHNIPAHIVQIVATVPIGKGMAGLAAERKEPVSICNLQTDTSGDAKPAAKSTGLQASLAVPMLVQGELRGVLGIGKMEAHEWTKEEEALLLSVAAALGEKQ